MSFGTILVFLWIVMCVGGLAWAFIRKYRRRAPVKDSEETLEPDTVVGEWFSSDAVPEQLPEAHVDVCTDCRADSGNDRETPHVKDLLHLKWSDQIPRVFRFAGRTFVFSSRPHPNYMVCATEEDLAERRREVLDWKYLKERSS